METLAQQLENGKAVMERALACVPEHWTFLDDVIASAAFPSLDSRSLNHLLDDLARKEWIESRKHGGESGTWQIKRGRRAPQTVKGPPPPGPFTQAMEASN